LGGWQNAVIFFLTRKGEWYRPDEMFGVSQVWISVLYNFYLEPHHELVVGVEKPTLCAGLGSYCPRYKSKREKKRSR
jgi:hypothetical protein